MAATWSPLTAADKTRYQVINKENLEFLMNRYNKVNRWVIADMIRRSAYHYPDKPALIYGDKTLTYTELERECNRTALGVQKYDRVSILAHNTIHHVLTWIGCAKIGAIYLAINYLLRGKDIAYCINHSESKIFIVEDALFDLVKDVMDDMPTVKTFLWSDQVAGQPPANDRFQGFDAWYGKYPDTEPDVILHIEDPCQMTYTSGTGSLPDDLYQRHGNPCPRVSSSAIRPSWPSTWEPSSTASTTRTTSMSTPCPSITVPSGTSS